MAKVMKATEFVDKLVDVAKNYKTLYVMGCFGSPMTAANKRRYCDNHEYNRRPARTAMIQAATADTFGFDCVNLIKGILWGWNGNKKATYGGAKYKLNEVPDTSADGMIKLCENVTTDFSKIEVGEAVWCKGHIGIYIGGGLAVESTPSWKNCVQITAVKNIGTKSGYNARTWTSHGKLPYIEYDVAQYTDKVKTEGLTAKPADKKDTSLAGKYKVSGCGGLHIRTSAGKDNPSIGTIKPGDIVNNYGYYRIDPSTKKKWLYIKTKDGVIGYCSASFLTKV